MSNSDDPKLTQLNTQNLSKVQDSHANPLDVDILENNRFSSEQLEGLTDSDELDEEFREEQTEPAEKTKEKHITTHENSEGNQAIREAVEELDVKQLEQNLNEKDPDHPSPNPAPFISHENGK
ncbi:hypothetical protein [Acinetobacter guerrae]|uniref:hypothetical protein n=1 Tax=Acinetobacter guerrae TaxID=1843371 RepID=UPI00128B95A0|nr:hypothetical protein [Acinetobacter guerrae]MPW45497.1 hypothetical protein [Acinetobacter guerrae]